jgi:hypothetical protein
MPALSFAQAAGSTVHHLLSGSYTNHTLFLLAFDTLAKTLTLTSQVPAFGLHQFVTSNAEHNRVYATAMSEPPQLFSWAIDENWEFTHLDTVNISKSNNLLIETNAYWLLKLLLLATFPMTVALRFLPVVLEAVFMPYQRMEVLESS